MIRVFRGQERNRKSVYAIRGSSQNAADTAPLQFFVFSQFKRQVAQLTGIDLARRIRHQIHAAIVLREGHHVANALFAGDKHDQAIETEGDSAVRRRAEPQRAEQMPELGLLIFRSDAERFEHFLLQLRLVNPETPAADLDTVQYDVVRLG